MVGARHAVGAHQGTAIELDADHGELSILEAETGIAGRGEAEKRIGPMPDSKNFLSIECAHGFWFSRFRQMEKDRVVSAPEEAKTPAISDDLTSHLDRCP